MYIKFGLSNESPETEQPSSLCVKDRKCTKKSRGYVRRGWVQLRHTQKTHQAYLASENKKILPSLRYKQIVSL